MATRGEKILNRVRLRLPQNINSQITEGQIFAVATEVSRQLAEEFMCVETSFSLSVVANTASYDLTTNGGSATGFFRMKLIAAPLTSNARFVEMGVDDFDVQERYSNTSSAAAYDQYYKIWNNTLKFYPTPTSSATYTIYHYKTPTTTISTSVTPETPAQFDDAIVFGTLEELLSVYLSDASDKFSLKYYSAKSEAFLRWRDTKTTSYNIVYSDI